MTQKKPEGEKYPRKYATIRPDQAKAIESWPHGKFSRVCQEAIDRELGSGTC